MKILDELLFDHTDEDADDALNTWWGLQRIIEQFTKMKEAILGSPKIIFDGMGGEPYTHQFVPWSDKVNSNPIQDVRDIVKVYRSMPFVSVNSDSISYEFNKGPWYVEVDELDGPPLVPDGCGGYRRARTRVPIWATNFQVPITPTPLPAGRIPYIKLDYKPP